MAESKCVRCGEIKPFSDFPKDKHRKGCYSYCNKCCSEKANKYRYANIDLCREKDRNRPEVGKEKKRTRERKRYADHTEEKKAYQRKYNLAHPGKSRIQVAKRRQHIYITGSYTFQEWEQLKRRYGYKCLGCGKKEPEIKLTADHVVPVLRGGSGLIDNIQPLCMECNHRKFTKTIDYRIEGVCGI